MASVEMQKYLIKPFSVAAAASVLTVSYYGVGDNLKVGNMYMNSLVGIGVCVFAADIVAQVAADELAKTNQLKGLVELETGLMRSVVTGGALLLSTRLLIGPTRGMNEMGQIFGLGVLSEMAGSYVYNMTDGLYTKG